MRFYIHSLVKDANYFYEISVNLTIENKVLAYLVLTVAAAYFATIAPFQMIGCQSIKRFIKHVEITVSLSLAPLVLGINGNFFKV